MPNNDLLSDFSAHEVREFTNDFREIIRVASELDRYYGKSEYDADLYLKNFATVIKNFNQKYKGIRIKLIQKIDSLELKIFLKEKSLKDFFANSASRIKGLIAAGLSDFNEVAVGDADKFARLIDGINGSLYLSYVDAEFGSSNIVVYQAADNLIEVLHDSKELSAGSSATFKIIAYYALREGIKRDVRVYEQLMSFGFLNLLNEIEKREWLEKFSPRYLE